MKILKNNAERVIIYVLGLIGAFMMGYGFNEIVKMFGL